MVSKLRIQEVVDRTFAQSFCRTFGKSDMRSLQICAGIENILDTYPIDSDFDNSSFERITDICKDSSEAAVSPPRLGSFLLETLGICRDAVFRYLEEHPELQLEAEQTVEIKASFEKLSHDTFKGVPKEAVDQVQGAEDVVKHWWLGNRQVAARLETVLVNNQKKWRKWSTFNELTWHAHMNGISREAAKKVCESLNLVNWVQKIQDWERYEREGRTSWFTVFDVSFSMVSTVFQLWFYTENFNQSLRNEIYLFVVWSVYR